MSGNLYQQSPFEQSANRPPRSNKLLWGILAFFGLFVPILCCGGILLLGRFGLGVLAADIEMQVRDHPVIQEHIGEIEELEVDFVRSAALEDPDTSFMTFAAIEAAVN